jgi:curli biogenesis system outer membrane secretion channel CsgG
MNLKASGPVAAVMMLLIMTGCAQKVQVKALNPAEVGEMAKHKKVAITGFRNDSVGLSGKIEAQIARQKLDNKRYFTVLSRKDLDSVMREQQLQSSELLDARTASKVGALIGAQAIVNGELATVDAESDFYRVDKKECLSYYKDGSGCARWRFYKVTCRTTQAAVAANINIVDIETGSIIYADTLSKNYSADSCHAGYRTIYSKEQAVNKLASDIASEFVYKLSPHYIYFSVALLDSIEIDTSDENHDALGRALAFIKAGRMDKADSIMEKLMTDVDGRSYVVAYVYGVVKEAQGEFDEAKELYMHADALTTEPVAEINLAVGRIDRLIEKRDEARRQLASK